MQRHERALDEIEQDEEGIAVLRYSGLGNCFHITLSQA